MLAQGMRESGIRETGTGEAWRPVQANVVGTGWGGASLGCRGPGGNAARSVERGSWAAPYISAVRLLCSCFFVFSFIHNKYYMYNFFT